MVGCGDSEGGEIMKWVEGGGGGGVESREGGEWGTKGFKTKFEAVLQNNFSIRRK